MVNIVLCSSVSFAVLDEFRILVDSVAVTWWFGIIWNELTLGSRQLRLQGDYNSWCFECESFAINFVEWLTLKHQPLCMRKSFCGVNLTPEFCVSLLSLTWHHSFLRNYCKCFVSVQMLGSSYLFCSLAWISVDINFCFHWRDKCIFFVAFLIIISCLSQGQY